jgi:hypothetical protein
VDKVKPRWLAWLQAAPKQALALLKGTAESTAYSLAEAAEARRIWIRRDALAHVGTEVRRRLKQPPASPPPLNAAEEQLVRRLRSETARCNRNNITRTAAYLAVYRACPELHWALLAHLVSRNGGWTMTDLKGELLPCLLGAGQRDDLFHFLERANGLIFHDAYPQLLLYQESARTGRSLTHLLPRLGVSAFMQPIWDEFLRSRDSALLTCALIVNEQHFIEHRVAQHPFYKKQVLETPAFKMQSLLQLGQVVFPYEAPDGSQPPGGHRLRLAGLILDNFADLRERIRFGHQLYAILFGMPDVHAGVLSFVRRQQHTASRADYWPELYASVRRGTPNPVYRPRLDGTGLAPGSAPLFSPCLEHAWKDRPVEPPEPGDWLCDDSALELLPAALHVPFSFDMTNEHTFGLHKIELAILAAQELGSKE